MVKDIRAYVIREASEVAKRAETTNRRRGSTAFKQFAAGQWQVITREHPECAPFKHVYNKALEGK